MAGIRGIVADDSLTTGEVGSTFQDYIAKADGAIEAFITAHTDATTGSLDLSASDSLGLQKLMSDQSIAAQTGTTTLKSLKDSIIAAARNI
ncbi:hypothetical protein LL266_16895 [Vibrio anguillarum]|uniref:hypothetical protein n=1 Tax=Vibrio TaxID=662 RepID=UPI0002D30FDC|nr:MULTISPECIES: hypothetical protein [Vibrio]MCC4238169.1 hypothetical protein [Vibrio anguillarum]MDT3848555.1 hypothetical protein [Vibrio anguillarum]OEE72569.1 hypothetical protein A1QQ_06410 [Vibrio ordalii FF-167]